jgi:hypothetical protein
MKDKENHSEISRQKQLESEKVRREKFENLLATMEKDVPEELRNEINVQARYDKMRYVCMFFCVCVCVCLFVCSYSWLLARN